MSAARTPTPEGRVRNVRAWNATRAGILSGADTTVAICDELLALREQRDALVAALLTVRDEPGFEAQHGTDFARHVDLLLKAAKGEA